MDKDEFLWYKIGVRIPIESEIKNCINDIVNGNVDIDDVAVILSNSLNNTEDEWERCIKNFSRSLNGNETRVREIITDLRSREKILQSRLVGHKPMSTSLLPVWINLNPDYKVEVTKVPAGHGMEDW